MLDKMLNPEVAKRLRGKLIFEIDGYLDDTRELYVIPEVREWMAVLDCAFPYWFYFMNVGPQSTLSFVVRSLCRYEGVPGDSVIPPDELQRFIIAHFAAMNVLASKLGDSQQDVDAQSREIGRFFAPDDT